MKLYLDNELLLETKKIEEVKMLVDELTTRHKGKIIQFYANGKLINNLNQISDKAIVNCVLKEPQELVLEGIKDGISYLPRLISGLEDVAISFQEGNIGKGIETFLDAMDGLEWLNHILHGIEYYYLGSNAMDTGKYQSILDFRNNLKLLTEAWENQDYIYISDILLYEIVPVLENIKVSFKDWHGSLRSAIDG